MKSIFDVSAVLIVRRPSWVYLTAAFVLFACYLAVATTPHYVGDDWTMLWKRDLLFQYDIGSGRWMSHVIRWLFADAAYMPALTMIIFSGLIAYASLLMAEMFDLDDLHTVFLVALFSTLPFFIETISFNLLHVTVPLSIVLSVLSARCFLLVQRVHAKSGLLSFSCSVILLVLAISIYQSSALVFAVLIMFHVARQNGPLEARQLALFFAWIAGVVLLSGLLYFLLNKLVQILSSTDDIWSVTYNVSSGYVFELDKLAGKISEVFVIWHDFLFGHLHGFFPVSQFSFAVFIGALILYWGVKAWRHGLVSGLVWVVFVIGLVFLPHLLFIIRETYPVRYNNLFPFGLVFVLAAVLLCCEIKSGWLHKACVSLLALTVIANIIAHNVVAHGKRLIFVRDIAISTRILGQIESELKPEDVGRTIPIYLHGKTTFTERTLPFGDSWDEAPDWQKYFVTSAAECSVYACQSGRLYWVFPIVGSDFQFRPLGRRLTNEERKVARSAPYWPLPGSVFRLGDFFVVKFHRG